MGEALESGFEMISRIHSEMVQEEMERKSKTLEGVLTYPAEFVVSREEAKKVIDSCLENNSAAYITWYQEAYSSTYFRDKRTYRPKCFDNSKECIITSLGVMYIKEDDVWKESQLCNKRRPNWCLRKEVHHTAIEANGEIDFPVENFLNHTYKVVIWE